MKNTEYKQITVCFILRNKASEAKGNGTVLTRYIGGQNGNC
ncbi:hypothetical protein [Sphingobacterium lactis]